MIANVADQFAVNQSVLQFANALDTGDWALEHSGCAADVVVTIDTVGVIEGWQPLADRVGPGLGALAVAQHYVTNCLVTLAGDRATAKAYFISHHVPKAAAMFQHGGVWTFELMRAGDQWLITSIVIRILWEADVQSRAQP